MFAFLLINMLFSSLLLPNKLYAREKNKLHELDLVEANGGDYIDYFSTDIKDFYHPKKSSRYPSANLFDGSFNTCWVAGNSKTGKSNFLYVKLPEKIELNKIILNIFPGYGKSRILYYKNCRPKKLKVSIYAAIKPDGYATEVSDRFLVKKYSLEKYLELKDSFGIQSFPLNLDKNNLLDFQKATENEYKLSMHDKNEYMLKFTSVFILKIEIKDVYKGKQYDDICISEIFFNNRFITPYPLKYREAKRVYIKNGNTLVADYINEQGVIIFKDLSSIFTMVDWIANGNYAVLHYVTNDAGGIGTRVEEQYHLVDLKNRKIVDNEFYTYTGVSIMFQVLEKDKYGRIYIGNDKNKIELK
ncbi:MAG: hypothetical protein GXP49_07460 [Deltaproteobacteria bacterium]|nr:hypothetical protein [Deltaproteobacteria bacterium]